MRKLICAILSVILLLGTAVTAWAEDTATLTITPDKTEVTANGSVVQVKFTITVTPPEGRELGVFSFRLKPSGGMTLPERFKENGESVITYAVNNLPYDVTTGKGVFRTYEYTPGSCFFAACWARLPRLPFFFGAADCTCTAAAAAACSSSLACRYCAKPIG